MQSNGKPIIALTMGDPCGIGPEIIAKTLASSEVHSICRPVVIGNAWSMEQAVKLVGAPLSVREVESPVEAGLSPETLDVLDLHNLTPSEITVGRISPACGRAAMEWVTRAGELALEGQVAALATAPVNKEAASLAGYKAIGHMELLQELCDAPDVATMLTVGPLRIVHLTTHKSLRQACDFVTKDGILAKLELTHNSFTAWGFGAPRIGVAALNPHGSDGGLLGHEEAEEIAPAVEEARARGINASGPVSADVVFHQAVQGRYDAVLALYHDQGHIAAKVYSFDEGITATLGLPFVRTSVDHGTAFDIAGQGIAQHKAMSECVKAAVSLSTGKGLG